MSPPAKGKTAAIVNNYVKKLMKNTEQTQQQYEMPMDYA
jgi:hypothetical protein